MKINEITQPVNTQDPESNQPPMPAEVPQQAAATPPAPQPAQPAPHPVHQHKRTDGEYEMEQVWTTNPFYNPEDDESAEDLLVTVTFDIEGENRASTWGRHGGEPAEYATAEIMSAYDENGVDVWDELDPVSRDRIQADADERVQEIMADQGSDEPDYDDYDRYDESIERIKNLSGLK